MHSVLCSDRGSNPLFRPTLGFAAACTLALCASLHAADLSVPNGSFELPSTTFVDPRVDSWTKTPQPDWFDPASTGGITWDQMTGVFANVPAPDPRFIDNLDGNQALFMIALPQVGLSQVLTAPEARFEVGFSYQLTVGLLGGGGLPEGTALQLGLFYLDGANLPVPVGSATVSYSTAVFPSSSHLVDQSLALPAVQAGDAWAGKSIGISIVGVSGVGAGYWDIDNVRLSATAVPEPGALALSALGLCGLGWAMRRSRSRG